MLVFCYLFLFNAAHHLALSLILISASSSFILTEAKIVEEPAQNYMNLRFHDIRVIVKVLLLIEVKLITLLIIVIRAASGIESSFVYFITSKLQELKIEHRRRL